MRLSGFCALPLDLPAPIMRGLLARRSAEIIYESIQDPSESARSYALRGGAAHPRGAVAPHHDRAEKTFEQFRSARGVERTVMQNSGRKSWQMSK